MKLSDKIRILRKARGMSQEEFGYSLSEATEGVSRQTVSDWENGKFEPKLDNIRDIARVLDVSFDVLLDESIDLNDAEVLRNVLHNVSPDTKQNVNTKTRYDIFQYKLTKKDYIKLSLYIAALLLFIPSVIFIVVGLTSGSVALSITGYVLVGIAVVLMPTEIINLIWFTRNYKNPRGPSIGEINNTHLIIKTYKIASNVIYLPIDKIKSITVADGAKIRHGDAIISLVGRERPVTLINIAYPFKLVEFYTQLLKIDEETDIIKII